MVSRLSRYGEYLPSYQGFISEREGKGVKRPREGSLRYLTRVSRATEVFHPMLLPSDPPDIATTSPSPTTGKSGTSTYGVSTLDCSLTKMRSRVELVRQHVGKWSPLTIPGYASPDLSKG